MNGDERSLAGLRNEYEAAPDHSGGKTRSSYRFLAAMRDILEGTAAESLMVVPLLLRTEKWVIDCDPVIFRTLLHTLPMGVKDEIVDI